jgi:hypothetical protein
MRCAACHAESPAGTRFCRHCGKPLAAAAPAADGAPVTPAADGALATPAAPATPGGDGALAPPATTVGTAAPEAGAPGRSRAFDWKWIVFGAVVITGTQYIIVTLVFPLVAGASAGAGSGGGSGVLRALVEDGLAGRLPRTLVLMAALLAAGYLAGGAIVGRMSAGHTVVEPALAALVPVLFTLAQVLVRDREGMAAAGVATWRIAGALVGALVPCFLLAMLGGWLGEKWQDLAQR